VVASFDSSRLRRSRTTAAARTIEPHDADDHPHDLVIDRPIA
jgi:hypothetical protein